MDNLVNFKVILYFKSPQLGHFHYFPEKLKKTLAQAGAG